MKHKIILPLLAIIFAAATAFATPFFVQMGYYDTDGVGGASPVHAAITDPGATPLCGSTGTAICKIDGFDAYVSAQTATAGGSTGLLRYNP